MKITKEWLKEHDACKEGIKLFYKHKKEIKTDRYIIEELLKTDHFEWANWVVVELMDGEQRIKYAIFSAKLVLPIFEKESPKDSSPRKAIETAEECLKDPNNKEKIFSVKNAAYAAYASSASASSSVYNASSSSSSAAYSAASAASAAYSASASASASAAAYVAYTASAASAAYASSASATATAYAASYAAYAASSAAKSDQTIKDQIIAYAINLLEL